MALLKVDLNPDRKALRTFGVIWMCAFALIGGWIRLGNSFLFFDPSPASALALWGVAAAGGLLAFVAPSAIRPVYVLLTLVTLPIGLVASYLVVGVLFYVVLVPVGLVRRVVGRDPLERRFVSNQASYWCRREPAADVTRYYKQY